MSDEIQQAIDFLRSEREREAEVYVVHLSTGYGIEHVWTLLDHIDALEAVKSTLSAFYALCTEDELLHDDTPAALKERIAKLEAVAEVMRDIATYDRCPVFDDNEDFRRGRIQGYVDLAKMAQEALRAAGQGEAE